MTADELRIKRHKIRMQMQREVRNRMLRQGVKKISWPILAVSITLGIGYILFSPSANAPTPDPRDVQIQKLQQRVEELQHSINGCFNEKELFWRLDFFTAIQVKCTRVHEWRDGHFYQRLGDKMLPGDQVTSKLLHRKK